MARGFATSLLFLFPYFSFFFAAPDASACECPKISAGGAASEDAKGVIWAGEHLPRFKEIVEMIAPVFWYTEDEPPIVQGDTPLPHAHPCDPNPKGGAVYYQINWVVLREGGNPLTK